jgi:feruloyl-CoA synthase
MWSLITGSRRRNRAGTKRTHSRPTANSANNPSLFAAPDVHHERTSDGAMILRSRLAKGPLPRAVGVWLETWAEVAPTRTFLAEREPSGGWRKMSYADTARAAKAVGQALIDRGVNEHRPLMILAENGIDHAVMALGAMHVGIPVVPVSTAYARLSQDFGKLRHILALVDPPLVYVDEAERYAKALAAVGTDRFEVVASRGAIEGANVTPFAKFLQHKPTSAVDAAFARVGPDTVAKVLFTSGSTGTPKGVINTQRMLCANQESIAAAWPFVTESPPVIVDWLPWNHTFGANHNFNMMLRNGGTLYIDEGKPVPALIARTVANLKEISPTIYFNVPRGYGVLLEHLERDEALQHSFFRELQLLFYAGAALPQSLWDRLDALALKIRGRRVPFVSSWGLTETAPLATIVHFPIDRPGNIGVPAPGMEIKLVPVDDKLEIRVKGDSVTPGYFKDPDLTSKAFDEQGWLKTGDAARLADPNDPAQGLIFDGRTAENFKLSSGVWVNVGMLRTAVIAAGAPMIEDAVVTGHDRDEIGLLIFPSVGGLRSLCSELGPEAKLEDMVASAAVRKALRDSLARHNAEAQGSSRRIARCLLMTEPPSIDANEITDKGYLNQRAVLTRRAPLVERLYATPAPPEVIEIP